VKREFRVSGPRIRKILAYVIKGRPDAGKSGRKDDENGEEGFKKRGARGGTDAEKRNLL